MVYQCSFAVCLVIMSVDRCWDGSVDRCRISCPKGMVEKSIFLSTDSSVLYSSFLLRILIIFFYMQGISGGYHIVCRHGGIVVVILPIVWTTFDRIFQVIVDRFLVGTVDWCGCVSFKWRRILCLVLNSTLACCYESWIINSSSWLELDYSRHVSLWTSGTTGLFAFCTLLLLLIRRLFQET